MPGVEWPPLMGKEFIRSSDFARELVDLSGQLAERYPQIDFTDAVAQVFAWFDKKLSQNRRFINAKRFPTRDAFRAYLRQALWNAGRMAMRERQRFERLEALPVARPLVTWGTNPEERVSLLELVATLPEPHRTVFERCFEGEQFSAVALALRCTEEEVQELFVQATDMLGEKLFPDRR